MPENYRDYPQEHSRRRSEGGNRYGRQYRGRRHEDRGFIDRTGDEIRSWFGDEEAERRRHLDEQEDNWRNARDDYRESGRRYRGEGERAQREFGGVSREQGRYEGEDQGSGGRGTDRRSDSRRYDVGQDRGDGANAFYRSGQNPDHFYNQGENQGGRYWRQSQLSDPDYSRRNFGNRYASEFDRGYGFGSSGGPFRGRGPSGWRRSDERITESIHERLEEHGPIDADGISVTVKEGEVTLSGTKNSKTEKRLAELVAESCSGVKDVQNLLRVRREQNQYGSRMDQWGQSGQRSETDQGSQTAQTGTESSTRTRSTSM